MFSSIIQTEMNAIAVLICIGIALLCGLVISLVYHRISQASQNFLLTLVMLPALVCVVIMLVNGNLGASVAVVGAFSLVRFRSIPGSSLDILGVFFVMAVGLATGMGYAAFALIMTLLLSFVMTVLHLCHFGISKSRVRELKIIIPEDLNYTDIFDDLFESYTREHRLIKTKTTNLGSLFELTYHIQMKDQTKEKEMMDALRTRNGNLTIISSEIKNNLEEL